MRRKLSPRLTLWITPDGLVLGGHGWAFSVTRSPVAGEVTVLFQATGKVPTRARTFWRKRLEKLQLSRLTEPASDAVILEDMQSLALAWEEERPEARDERARKAKAAKEEADRSSERAELEEMLAEARAEGAAVAAAALARAKEEGRAEALAELLSEPTVPPTSEVADPDKATPAEE